MANSGTTPSGSKDGRSWIGFIFFGFLGLLIYALIPKNGPAPETTHITSPTIVGYHPKKLCSTPAPTGVNASTNNPLGIKYAGELVKKVGEDSGIVARDGGTFAKFSTREIAFDTGEKILRSKNGLYAGKTTDQAMRKWSNGSYGAEVAAGTGITPDAPVNDLPEAQMGTLLAAMAIREHNNPVATAILWINPNDHYGDRNIQEFVVSVPMGCFSDNMDWVIPPQYWRGWAKEVDSNDPDAKIGIWFFGWSASEGPFTAATMPDYPYPPSNRWRLEGAGNATIWVKYTQTS